MGNDNTQRETTNHKPQKHPLLFLLLLLFLPEKKAPGQDVNRGFHAQERRRIAFPSVCLCAPCVCVCALIKDTRFFKHIRAIFSNCLPAPAVSSLTQDGDGGTKRCWPSYLPSITLSRPTGPLRGTGPENYDLLEGERSRGGGDSLRVLSGEEAEEHTKGRACRLHPPLFQRSTRRPRRRRSAPPGGTSHKPGFEPACVCGGGGSGALYPGFVPAWSRWKINTAFIQHSICNYPRPGPAAGRGEQDSTLNIVRADGGRPVSRSSSPPVIIKNPVAQSSGLNYTSRRLGRAV